MDLTVACVRRPVAVQAEASFWRREHPPRLAQHRGAARNAQRRISAAGRQMGRSDREVARVSEVQTHFWKASDGVSLPIARRAGPAGHPAPRPVFRRQYELDQVRHRRRDRGRRVPSDHARPSRAWAERQAARGRALSEGHPCPRPARAGGSSCAQRVRSRRILARRANDGRGGGRGAQAAPRDPRRRGARGIAQLGTAQDFFLHAIDCSTRSSAAIRTGCRSSS